MKKLILSASFAFALLTTSNTFAQQGFGTNQPDRSAAVDIVSSKRGLLIPRISIADLNQAAPVHQPANALFVYNTNSATGEGFYYWERDDKTLPTPATYTGKWVRFTSSVNEKDVIVQAAANGNIDIPTATYDANGVKTYNVSVKGGADGQVLVSNATGGTKWVNPEDFVKDVVNATNGLTYVPSTGTGVDNIIKLGGALTENTTITTVNGETDPDNNRSLTIAGLETVSNASHIMVMNADGLLQKMERTALLDAKNLTLGDGLAFEAGIDDNDGVGAVLKATKIEIKDNSVTAVKLDAKAETEGHVATVNADGTVSYKTITPGSLTDKKTLTTDGVIVIGADSDATATAAAESVLADVKLNIGKDKITAAHIATGAVTSDEILDGTIQVADIKAPGTTTDSSTGGTANQVMVTNANGDVSWINQSDLGNQDSFYGTLPISVTPAAGTNATGGTDYTIAVATATGPTLGVVKEAATPTVNINATGELAVNLTNTVLTGDVTGPLNATKVEAIQGTAVSATTTPDATNNVLKFVPGTGGAAGAWTPSQLQGTDVAGKAITSTSLTVSADGATAALKDVTINITPGTAEGQILTTTNTGTITDPVLSTNWATPNSLVAVDNGLKKVADDVIHLGGALKEVTEIAASATHTLAISGLQPATETLANKVVVSEDTTGILRTVERVVQGTNVDVAANSDYSFFTPEVVLNITLPATGDVTVKFPAAASAVGQVINIKIVNTDDTHTGYLNVLDTYGSMPYQGWIVKSNGSAWVIVGRN